MADILFDKSRFLASLAEDDELARELLEAFLEDGPARIAGIRQALEMDDAGAVSTLAHSLKGMCGVVRAEALSQLAFSMELAGRDGKLDVVREQFVEFESMLDQAVEQMKEYMAG